jgi:Rrf2 family protein
MMISSRGRYALRVLADLAAHGGAGYVPMKEIAARQGISLKYIEKIMPLLTKAGLVSGVAGKGGGYMLSAPPEECRVGEILRLTEGSLAPVQCLTEGETCARAEDCPTLSMWKRFDSLTNAFFDSVTLADLIGQ